MDNKELYEHICVLQITENLKCTFENQKCFGNIYYLHCRYISEIIFLLK